MSYEKDPNASFEKVQQVCKGFQGLSYEEQRALFDLEVLGAQAANQDPSLEDEEILDMDAEMLDFDLEEDAAAPNVIQKVEEPETVHIKEPETSQVKSERMNSLVAQLHEQVKRVQEDNLFNVIVGQEENKPIPTTPDTVLAVPKKDTSVVSIKVTPVELSSPAEVVYVAPVVEMPIIDKAAKGVSTPVIIEAAPVKESPITSPEVEQQIEVVEIDKTPDDAPDESLVDIEISNSVIESTALYQDAIEEIVPVTEVYSGTDEMYASLPTEVVPDDIEEVKLVSTQQPTYGFVEAESLEYQPEIVQIDTELQRLPSLDEMPDTHEFSLPLTEEDVTETITAISQQIEIENQAVELIDDITDQITDILIEAAILLEELPDIDSLEYTEVNVEVELEQIVDKLVEIMYSIEDEPTRKSIISQIIASGNENIIKQFVAVYNFDEGSHESKKMKIVTHKLSGLVELLHAAIGSMALSGSSKQQATYAA